MINGKEQHAWMNAGEVNPDARVAEGVISRAVLEGLRKLQQPGEPDFVEELIDLFLRDTEENLRVLRGALLRNNATEVRHLAHLMKGSSANIGASRMAALYEELERKELGLGTCLRDSQELILSIEDEFRQVEEAFRAVSSKQ
ncbi:MAG TPA: Hpt domain-containing protein [Pyrinomonadaceae bacterium]|jgi:HPt (histidine-containing phosphotransfer) domain-containing protein|nr:Hpt domain-containing protein [Pyrinomonadaceae bacterium]